MYFYIKTGSLQNYWSCNASSARFMSLSLPSPGGSWAPPGLPPGSNPGSAASLPHWSHTRTHHLAPRPWVSPMANPRPQPTHPTPGCLWRGSGCGRKSRKSWLPDHVCVAPGLAIWQYPARAAEGPWCSVQRAEMGLITKGQTGFAVEPERIHDHVF